MSVRRGRSRALVIARTELRQLRQAPDFWVPLAVIAGLFFVVIPAACCCCSSRTCRTSIWSSS